jgi:hypothetical protein
MITWGSANGDALSADEHAAFEESLNGHAWVRAFPSAVVVGLLYDDERREIIDGLADVAKTLNDSRESAARLFVLVSPPIPKESGPYSGWAPKSVWPELNKRSIQ